MTRPPYIPYTYYKTDLLSILKAKMGSNPKKAPFLTQVPIILTPKGVPAAQNTPLPANPGYEDCLRTELPTAPGASHPNQHLRHL